MSKANDKALALLQRTKKVDGFAEKFEEQEVVSTQTFRAVFDSMPLSDNENAQIHTLLEEATEQLSTAEVNTDHQTLTEITTQIRAIERQSIVLHGERIYKAQQILKKYHDGTFTKWLQLAYGNRQTPYRILQFYDLYTALEDKEKALISNMPKRAAYSLASRKGDVNKKIEIIKEHHDSPPEEIIRTVQEAFPLKESDRRKSSKKVNDIELLKAILPKIRKLRERKSLEKILFLVESELSKPVEKIADPNEMDLFSG